MQQKTKPVEEERHVPYLSSIERLAKEEGRQEAREEAWREGREEGAREELWRIIQELLKGKFFAANSRRMAKVRTIHELTQLRSLALELIKAESLQEVRDLP